MRRSAVADWYRSLGDYLAGQAATGQRQVVLSFAQLEAIIGHPLPPAVRRARTSRGWWRNDATQDQAWYGWLRAGWFVTAASAATETVTFTRGDDG